jgi:hypothetical protein
MKDGFLQYKKASFKEQSKNIRIFAYVQTKTCKLTIINQKPQQHNMKRKNVIFTLALLLIATAANAASKVYKPWSNGRLVVSENNRYLVHENGTPFFWLGNTAWLLPERLNRDEVEYYLTNERLKGYNVEQIQVLNAIPTFNVYGHAANNAEFDFSEVSKPGVYGYWNTLTSSLTLPNATASTSPWTASGAR